MIEDITHQRDQCPRKRNLTVRIPVHRAQYSGGNENCKSTGDQCHATIALCAAYLSITSCVIVTRCTYCAIYVMYVMLVCVSCSVRFFFMGCVWQMSVKCNQLKSERRRWRWRRRSARPTPQHIYRTKRKRTQEQKGDTVFMKGLSYNTHTPLQWALHASSCAHVG